MPYNGKKIVQIARERGIKAKDFRAAVFPNRTGNFSWDELKRVSNPNAETIEATANFLGCSIDELFDRPASTSVTMGDHIEANENSTAFKGNNSCNSRLLDIIESGNRQLDKAQSQLDKAQQQIDQLIEMAKRP